MPYIGKSPSAGVRQRYQYTATAGQTTFSGTDLGNLTLTYTDNNFVDVFQNGVLLKGGGTDYTATSGTSVVLATGASLNDVIEIIVYDVFSVGNFFNRTDSDSRYALNEGGVVFNETSADVDFRVESNGSANMLFVDGGNNRIGINNGTPSDDVELTPSADGKGITLKTTDNIRPYLNLDANRSSAGNNVAQINFKWNGTDVAGIFAVAGADTTNKDDGHITFGTSSAGSVNERMRIDSGGDVHIGSTAAVTGSTRVSIHQSSNQDCLQLENTDSSFSDRVIIMNAHRAANAGYQFLLAYSGDFADLEFNLRGDGNAYADGSWNGGGADYAEYFEWKDGNTSDEDRVGISVKLDGDKIVVSSDSDNASDIIGVISGNPSITGDSAWNKWNEKYLKDDYGRYKLDGNGERTLNPDYDKEKTYIAREDRKEWDVVGLMGKLRIKKGQKTGTNWIKMRDVSDTVEEWLVR